MKTVLTPLIFAFCLGAQTVAPAVTVEVSDQGQNVIRTLIGRKAPKGVSLLGVATCNQTSSALTVAAPRVFVAIARMPQHPRVILPEVVNAVLTNYQGRTWAARLTAGANLAAGSASLLMTSRLVAADAKWIVGVQLIPEFVQLLLPAMGQPQNLIGLGTQLISRDIALAPMACSTGFVVVESSTPIVTAELSVQ